MIATEKKYIHKYLFLLALIFIIACLWVILASEAASSVTEIFDKHYYRAYKEENKGYIAPWYTNGLHIVDEGFINELERLREDRDGTGHVLAIGSSLCATEFDPLKQKLLGNYDLMVFASGSGSWRTNYIMDKLIRQEYSYRDKDIVKIEVSYSTFRNADNKTILESVLDKWGKYSVTEDLDVKRNSMLFSSIYWLNVQFLKIQNVLELLMSYISPLDRMAQIGPGNYRNNFFNHEATAANFSITPERRKVVEEELMRISEDTNVIAEFSPIPEGLRETESGKAYMEYIDDSLIPLLEEKGIAYFDYRNSFSEKDFIDGAHLSYTASLRYTKRLDSDLNRVIRFINRKVTIGTAHTSSKI